MRKKIEFRCFGCHRLLAKTDGNTEIICPRCGGLNVLDIETKTVKFTHKSDRRSTSSGSVFR